jgi:hypothetical protein
MDIKFLLGAILLACLFAVSIPFETRYAGFLQRGAHNTGIQFMAGLALTLIAAIDPILACMALLVIFLWIADVKLLSSVDLMTGSGSAKNHTSE